MSRLSAKERRVANVLAFPPLQTIPPPSLPLTGVAHDKYMELAKGLLNAGKLTEYTKMDCEQFAIMHAKVALSLERNLPVSAKIMEQMSKKMKEMQLVDQSDAVAAPSSGQESRFARIGTIILPGTKKAEIRPS